MRRELSHLGGSTASSGSRHSPQHRAGVAVAADGDDLSVRHVDVLGEENEAADGVDVQDGDAVLAIGDEAND
jgi:hypothetical protein